jgi:hypothetical protein
MERWFLYDEERVKRRTKQNKRRKDEKNQKPKTSVIAAHAAIH